MANGMEHDLEFKKLIEGFLESDDPKELAKEIIYIVHGVEERLKHAMKDRERDCVSQYHSCSNRHKGIDLEIEMVKEKQKPPVLLTRIFQCLPTWGQKMIIVGTALYLILFSFGITVAAIYAQHLLSK